jgi:asparagine synthase (glutamine-hydrolysing)
MTGIGALVDFRERYLRRLTIFPEHTVRRALGLGPGDAVRRRVSGLFAESHRHDPPGAMMFVDQNLYLPDDLLVLLDKTTMAVGLEARVPLLDHRLVECAARLPGRLRMRDGQLKGLLRDALRGHLPDAILDRPKQGFGPPVSAWMSGPFGAAAGRLLRSGRTPLRHVLDPRWIARAMDGRSPLAAMRTWRLLVLELWWRTFVGGEDLRAVGVAELAEGAGTRWA